MAANESKTESESGGGKRAGWRGSGAGAALGKTDKYRFRSPGETTSRQVARQNLQRRVALTVLSSIVLALFAVFGWWWFKQPLPTPLLAIAITRYGAPLPPNSYAREDVQRFIEAAKKVPEGVLKVTEKPPGAEDKQDLHWNSLDKGRIVKQIETWLGKAKPGGPNRGLFGARGTVVVYISGHGVVDERGRACIIPADTERTRDSDADDGRVPLHLDAELWLPVADIVEALDRQRTDVNKLLVLDCSRIDSLWPMGLLYNGFAEALPAAVGKAESVAVLAASGPGQVAWPSVEWQCTPFGFYLSRALIGDPHADLNRNGRISVDELASFVEQRVSHWVGAHRRDEQRPFLWPPEAKFDVVVREYGAVGSEKDPEESVVQPPTADELAEALKQIKAAWGQLNELWGMHEEMQSRAKDETAPVWSEHCLAWHRFQQELVRCEMLVLAGEEYAEDLKACLADLEKRANYLKTRRHQDLPAHSLPLARRWRSWKPDPKLRNMVADRLRGTRKDVTTEVKNNYYVRADGAWQWLSGNVDGQAGPKARQALLEFVNSSPPSPQKNDLLEVHLLKLLALDGPSSLWSQREKWLAAALELREVAEQAAAPRDVRAHYAFRQRLAEADADLRRLENSRFIDEEACGQISPPPAEQKERFNLVERDADQLGLVFAQRDQAWAELPYVAEWVARRPDPSGVSLVPARVSKELRTLRDFDARLDAFLESFLRDAPADEAPSTLAELVRDAASIELMRSAWRQKLHDEVEPGNAADEVTLRHITALFASPLVTGRERQTLRDTFRKALETLRGNDSEPATAEGSKKPTGGSEGRANRGEQKSQTEESSGDRESPYVRRLREDHPALALVAVGEDESQDEAKPSAEGSWVWLAARGGKVRQELRRLLARSAAATAGDDGPARASYSEPARRLCAAAALCAAVEPVPNDALDRLAKFDLNEFLAWRAGRTLDDFWGSREEVDPQKAYFGLVWKELSDAAKNLREDDRAAVKDRMVKDFSAPWKPLDEKRKALFEAVKKMGFGEPWPDTTPASGETFQRKFPVLLAALPVGEAALYVLDPNRQVREAVANSKARERVAVSTSSAQTDPTLTIRRAAPADSPDSADGSQNGPWSAVCFYRGHRRSREFFVGDDKGIRIVYERPGVAEKATVEVEGKELANASIVFILDCSGSMNTPTNGPGSPRRMEEAQRALNLILDQLPENGQARLGLWLYGHRLNWTQTKPYEPVVNPAWPPPPNRVKPATDVEQVIDLTPFNAAKGQFQAMLGKAGPWGETPLYYSIKKAVSDTVWPPTDAPRHLVVITDGEDYQFGNPRGIEKPNADRALKEDRRERPRNPIRLHVLDCTGEEIQDLKELVVSNGGDYRSVRNWAALEKDLEKALGLAKYEVKDEVTHRSLDTKSLGKTITVPGPFDAPRDFRVSISDRESVWLRVRLQGDEALKLSIFDGGTATEKLGLEPYGEKGILESNSQHRKIEVPLDAESDFHSKFLHVTAHTARPQQRHDGVEPWTFPISIQDGGKPPGFSPRPAEAWVEITPLTADGKPVFTPVTADGKPVSLTYPFYDMLFEKDAPVPVLLCRVPDWPPAGRQAEIRVWFKFSETRSEAIKIGSLPTSDNPQPLDGLPSHIKIGVKFDDAEDGCILVVNEEHLKSDAQWLRVQSRKADEVRHFFGEGGRHAEHRFLFRKRTPARLRDEYLELASQESIKVKAISVDEPLKVEVPTRGF